jgi:hypothetical protein
MEASDFIILMGFPVFGFVAIIYKKIIVKSLDHD